MITKKYRIFYKYKNTAADKLYSTTISVIGTDTPEMVEYAWRNSSANVPQSVFIRAEEL